MRVWVRVDLWGWDWGWSWVGAGFQVGVRHRGWGWVEVGSGVRVRVRSCVRMALSSCGGAAAAGDLWLGYNMGGRGIGGRIGWVGVA